MKKLKVTPEAVLKAAKENPESKGTLKSLFPEVFEDEEKVFCSIGAAFRRVGYPNNLYVVFRWNGEVRMLNVTHNCFWDKSRNLKVHQLRNTLGTSLTVSEFKELIGNQSINSFKEIVIRELPL